MSSDIEKLRAGLKSSSLESIEKLLVSYIDQSERIELDAIVEALRRGRDPDAVANVVSALSFRRCTSGSLQDVVKSLAEGESWDTQDRARLQAIFALPRLCSADNSIKEILKKACRSDNIVVRDAALVAAQTYCGVPPPEMKWGDGEGNLARQVQKRVLDWLGFNVAPD
jgi:hypothetical protein